MGNLVEKEHSVNMRWGNQGDSTVFKKGLEIQGTRHYKDAMFSGTMKCLITSHHLSLNSSDYRDSCYICHMIRGKLLRSCVRGGVHPYTILNGCVLDNGTRVCSSGGCYAKACPEPFDIATVSIV